MAEVPEAKAATARKQQGFTITPEERSFWSFQPIQKPELPKVKQTDWPKAPIDYFVLAKLEETICSPCSPPTSVLLSAARLSISSDSPRHPRKSMLSSADSSPDAFAKVVDRLLASPHYGERWARHWLDIARYADGERRPTARRGGGAYANTWRYRDWVINALNRDMPYDRF